MPSLFAHQCTIQVFAGPQLLTLSRSCRLVSVHAMLGVTHLDPGDDWLRCSADGAVENDRLSDDDRWVQVGHIQETRLFYKRIFGQKKRLGLSKVKNWVDLSHDSPSTFSPIFFRASPASFDAMHMYSPASLSRMLLITIFSPSI